MPLVINSLAGKEILVPPDRHLATVRKRQKTVIGVSMWPARKYQTENELVKR